MKKKKLAIVGGIAAAVAGIVAYKNRDKIKKSLCEEHGIRVLYFTHENVQKNSDTFFDTSTLLNEIIKD